THSKGSRRRCRGGYEFYVSRRGIKPANHVGLLHGETTNVVAIENESVRVLGVGRGHRVLGDDPGLGIELPDQRRAVAREPDIAIVILSEAVRSGARGLEVILLHRAGFGIEPPQLVGELPSPPNSSVLGGKRIMRSRTRCRYRPLPDHGLDRASDDAGGGSWSLGKALDEIVCDGIPLIRGHGACRRSASCA